MNHLYQHMITLGEDKVCVRLARLFPEQLSQWSTPRHCNADYELHLVLEGSADMEVEEQIYSLSSFQALLIAPGKYHYPTVTSRPFRRFSVSFTLAGTLLPALLQEAMEDCLLFEVSPAVCAACETIYREFACEDPYRCEMLTAHLTTLLITVLRTVNQQRQKNLQRHASRITPEEESRIALIDAYFSTDYFHGLHTASKEARGEEALAEALHLSRRQLARVLQQHYGMNFRQKLISARMDRAAWLLRTSDKRCDEIATLVGYSSESAFYQAFRTFFHTTPHKYRQRHL